MDKRISGLAILVMCIMVALAFSGCATTSTGAAPSPRDLMVDAGFKQNVADEPAEKKHFDKLPGEKVLCYVRDGQKCYAYKDPATNSVYLGDEAAFNRYLDRAIQERLDRKHQMPFQIENDPEFWTIWMDRYGGG